jgi:tetratricopeptide (TPR) repeat protein
VVVAAAVAGCLFTAAGAVTWWQLERRRRDPAASSAGLRRRVDAALVAEREPVPPAACSTTDRRTLALLAPAAELLAGGAPRGARPHDLDALAQLEAAPAPTRAAPEYWYLLGRARLFAGRDAAAVGEAAQRAVGRCAGFAAAHNLAGTAAFVAGRDADALAEYERAAAAQRDYMTPQVNRGLVLLRLGRVPEATTALNEVVSRTPGRVEARVARGQAHLLAGEFALAVADLETAVKNAPDDALAHLLLGEAYGKAKRPTDAQKAYCRAQALGNAAAATLCRRDGGAAAAGSR